MLNSLKTLGTILTIVSTAQFGKELYEKYKDKKKKKQIEEVHEFIKNLDIEMLQKAIKTNDTDTLINVVENIISAAEKVRIKSEFEELKEDVQEATEKIFNTVTVVTDKVINTVGNKIDEVISNLENDFSQEKKEPTYSEFVNGLASLNFKINDKIYTVTINDENVFVNPKTKQVTFITPEKEIINKTLL